MPMPTDPEVVQTSKDIVAQLHTIFGEHPGFRAAHAKGILLQGTFTPTPTAAQLSSAPHFTQPSTPILVRFSNSTGIPTIPDNIGDADPRGCAVRFLLSADEHKHTDIVAHSTPFFPARTGAEFLALFRAIAASGAPDAPKNPSPVEQFLGTHPAALAFITAPKPAPTSFAREAFFGVNAFKLVGGSKDSGAGTFVRYRVEPVLGVEPIDPSLLASQSTDYLFEEIKQRLAKEPVEFRLRAQVAAPGDQTDDATVRWPDEREVVELGTLRVEGVREGEASGKQQKHLIFDPVPRVQGVEPSADPLIDMRAAVYLVSGKERRAAP